MSADLTRRLVVTGHDANGHSRVASDLLVSGHPVPNLPGGAISHLWGADTIMQYPDNGDVAAVEAFFPPLHGTRLVEFYLPPGATEYVDEQPQDSKMAEAAKLIKADRPGMHRTPTVDFVIVMEGRCDCELDEGKVTLSKGDVVVQNGTIHGWFNPYDEPCRFLAVMVGAKNDLCP